MPKSKLDIVSLFSAYDGLVQIAWNCDLGSPWDPKELEKYVQEHKGKIRSPLTLLTQTQGPDDIKYNELILKGDESTSIKGLFFRPQDSKTEYKGKKLGEVVSELMQSEVPVIELPAVPTKNYDNVKDPKEREMMRRLQRLMDFSLSLRSISQKNLKITKKIILLRQPAKDMSRR